LRVEDQEAGRVHGAAGVVERGGGMCVKDL
jgi:hypothetical protein